LKINYLLVEGTNRRTDEKTRQINRLSDSQAYVQKYPHIDKWKY